jgi:hypothetical protein
MSTLPLICECTTSATIQHCGNKGESILVDEVVELTARRAGRLAVMLARPGTRHGEAGA